MSLAACSPRRFGFVSVAVAALLLAGCQARTAKLGDTDSIATASTSAPAEGLSFKRTEALAKAFEKDKTNVAAGLAYADSLEAMGQKQSQLQVLNQVAAANPGNADAQARIGKKLLTMGAVSDAAAMLERAATLQPNNAQNLSALGSAYDQMSRHGEARDKYNAALAIEPGNMAIRNNLAMSHALQGQLPEAERQLRALNGAGGASMPRIRQNLALVVGLQGRFDEAKRIASEDLPPDEVEANMAYLQQMLAQPNTWKQLQDG
jgi:Flp pilus assembly protein TadD